MDVSVRCRLGHATHLFLGWILVILSWAVPVRGQTPGQLAGTIYDQTGSALPAVTVSLKGPQARATQTNGEGRLEFRNLQPGEYELTATLSGFEPLHRAIRVQPDQTSTVSLTMVVAILEQTVVTATKAGRGDVQSIPMAVSAVSDADLVNTDTHTVDQAAALVPNVTFTQNGTFGQLSIRGVGTNAVNAGSDPSSAMYLDGVYLARPAMVFADFLDLDRIEVLRGPQGTLYGRNAVGGAVNLISKSPTNDFQASTRITAGTLDELRAEARASGALKRDRIMGSVAFARGVRDGYVRDLDHPDHPLGGDDLTAARAQLRFVFNRRTDLLLASDVTDQDGTLLTFNKVLQAKPGFTIDNPSDLHEVRTSTTASSGLLQYGASARLTSTLTPSMTFVSLTAFRKLDNDFLVDADITELNVLATHNRERQHQFSQELTVSGDRQRLSWVGGVFFFDESDRQNLWVDQFATRTQVRLDPQVDATSAAVFGQTTLGLTSRLSATAGLRYTHEEKTIDNAGGRYTADATATQIAGTGYAYTDSIEHTAWTPKLSVDLKLPRTGIAYISATRGFKSGGFNPSSTQPGRGYAPEWAWSYEAGLKTELMGGRARLNVAAFDMDYTNLQVQTPIAVGVFDIRNAAEATIRGIELEGHARIGRGLYAGGHLAWLDATYDRYTAVGIGNVTGDVAGNRLNNAPEWSGRLWAEWTGNITASSFLSIAADATGQSVVFYTPFNDTIQRQVPYGLLGAHAEYGPNHRRWSVGAYMRNLTNTDYIMATFGTAPTAFGGRPGASRQVGVQFVVRR
jgi:iron complex outermembrane receptor protein